MNALLGHNWARGDELFVRASLEQACSDAFQVRIEDFPKFGVTIWVPVREIARLDDISQMAPMRRYDLKYLYAEINPAPKQISR
jgi:hypothetical protein